MKKLTNWLFKFIQKFGCEHDYEFVRNIYGDEINYRNGYRSEWKCKKCGKLQWRLSLYQEENINCQTFH